jgi:hypothetical protein
VFFSPVLNPTPELRLEIVNNRQWLDNSKRATPGFKRDHRPLMK